MSGKHTGAPDYAGDSGAHTPGPWRVEQHDGYMPGNWDLEPVQVVGSDGTVIACNTAFYPTGLDHKNARLIAAAPDMLEALLAVRTLGESDDEPGDDEYDRVTAFVDAAIARATGAA